MIDQRNHPSTLRPNAPPANVRSWRKPVIVLGAALAALAAVLSLPSTAAEPDYGAGAKPARKSWNPFSKKKGPEETSWDQYHNTSTSRQVAKGASPQSAALSNEKPPSTMQKVNGWFKGTFKGKPKNTLAPAKDADLGSSDLAPATPEFYVAAAKVELAAGNVETERRMYQMALSLNRKYAPALLGLARSYDRTENWQEANRHYEQAIAANPQSASAHNDYGLCLARQQQFDGSIAQLEQAVQLSPKQPLYRNNLATTLVQTGRLDEAIEHLSTVHKREVAHYNVGFLLNKLGNPEMALGQFQLALQANPQMKEAQIWADSLTAKLQSAAPAQDAPRTPAAGPSRSKAPRAAPIGSTNGRAVGKSGEKRLESPTMKRSQTTKSRFAPRADDTEISNEDDSASAGEPADDPFGGNASRNLRPKFRSLQPRENRRTRPNREPAQPELESAPPFKRKSSPVDNASEDAASNRPRRLGGSSRNQDDGGPRQPSDGDSAETGVDLELEETPASAAPAGEPTDEPPLELEEPSEEGPSNNDDLLLPRAAKRGARTRGADASSRPAGRRQPSRY